MTEKKRPSVETIRCSSLPRGMVCSSSWLPAKDPIDETSDIGLDGSAVHDVVDKSERDPAAPIDALISKVSIEHGADASEVKPLFFRWRKIRSEIASWLPSFKTEERLDADLSTIGIAKLTLTGRVDLVAVVADGELLDEGDGRQPDSILVGDLKSGYLEGDYEAQVKGYGLGALLNYGEPRDGFVTGVVIYVRLGTYAIYRWGVDELHAFARQLDKQRRQAGKQYAPGESCRYCKSRLECTARENYIRAASVALVPVDGKPIANLTDEQLVDLFPKAKQLGDALKLYERILRERLEAGPLDFDEKKQLALVESQVQAIKAREAWPILAGTFGLGDDALARATTLSKTKLLEEIGRDAPRGQKGKRRAEVIEALEAAGAIDVSYRTTRRLINK